MTDTTQDLKPCPFCGNTPRHLEALVGFHTERVICDSCWFHIESRGQPAGERWNRRAAPAQPTDAEILALKDTGEWPDLNRIDYEIFEIDEASVLSFGRALLAKFGARP